MGFSNGGDLIFIILWYHFLLILSVLFRDAFPGGCLEMLSWKCFIHLDGNVVLKDPSGSTPVWALQGKLLKERGYLFYFDCSKF